MSASSHYTLLTGETEYRAAVDAILDSAMSHMAIFDRDLAALRLQEPQRLAKLASFLHAQSSGERNKKLRIVIHQTHLLDSHLPQLITLFTRYAHTVDLRQSPDHLRQLADTHILADACHGVRRFHIDHARCALIQADPVAIHPWQQRFEELWGLSLPCLKVNTTGL
ncbi:MAG TPA: hypothetical protein VIM43_04750 [Rugosibacter sp.]